MTSRLFPLPEEIAVSSSESAWFTQARRPFTWIRSKNASTVVRQLLWTYRAALQEEIAGHLRRAAFYWRETEAQIEVLSARPEAFETALQELAKICPGEGEISLRERLLLELVLDGHAAAWNTWCASEAKRVTRHADFHLRAAIRTATRVGWSPRKLGEHFGPALMDRIEWARLRNEWVAAESAAQQGLSLDPADPRWPQALMGIYAARLETLSCESGAKLPHQAALLQELAEKLEILAGREYADATVYDLLARTYSLRAVRLANAKKFSDALEAVEIAHTIAPDTESIARLKQQLESIMHELQKKVAELVAAIRYKPNTTLNAAGQALRIEADRGFGPTRKFAGSSRASRLRNGANEARLLRFWLQLGLPKPALPGFVGRAEKLIEIMNRCLASKPRTPDIMAAEWKTESGELEFEGSQHEKVLAYLFHKQFAEAWDAAPPPWPDFTPDPIGTKLPLREAKKTPDRVFIFEWLRSRRHRLASSLVLAGGATLFVALVVAVPVGAEMLQFRRHYGPAAAYLPAGLDTAEHQAWADFRRARPFPCQTFAARDLPDGTVALILSEPAPTLDKAALGELIKDVFGDDCLSQHRLRWMIGVDGWLEDVVLKIRRLDLRAGSFANDAPFLDRVAILNIALFGVADDVSIEPIEPAALTLRREAPNLEVSPGEIQAWLDEPALKWLDIEIANSAAISWSDAMASEEPSTFMSSDGALVALILPRVVLAAARENPAVLLPLRVPFRKFALSSDLILGGMWNVGGQVAVLARARRSPKTVLPPLRFETFCTLVRTAGADELAQSYERTTPFAGKITREGDEHLFRDWAPILLSEPLLDQEFGALLNVTDQILKSWTQGGKVQYIFFNYLRPPSFPFGSEPLSAQLQRKYNTRGGLLFNWNTAGGAAQVNRSGSSILAVNHTGALPVTYGADGQTRAEGGHDLFDYEDKAYAYFAASGDPNLARVVQYTTLYKILHAVVASDLSDSDQPTLPTRPVPPLRIAARQLLHHEFTSLLNSPQIKEHALALYPAIPDLDNPDTQIPAPDLATAADLMLDVASPEAQRYLSKVVKILEAAQQNWNSNATEHDRRVDDYNLLVARLNSGVLDSTEATTMRQLKEQLELSNNELTERHERLKELKDRFIGRPRQFASLVTRLIEPSEIFRRYAAANAAEPAGSVKTPSVVLSWSQAGTTTATGGHNLDAAVARFERDPTVKGIEFATDPNGKRILRYNPNELPEFERNAPKIARLIEHTGETDVAILQRLAERSAPIRTRSEALHLGAPQERLVASATLGERVRPVVGDRPGVAELRALAEENDHAVFVTRDANGATLLAETNPSPPPTVLVLQARDTPSLVQRLQVVAARRGKTAPREVIFLGEPEAHVQAIALGLEARSGTPLARGTAHTAGRPRPTEVSGMLCGDFEGRPSMIRSIGDGARELYRRSLGRLTRRHGSAQWRQAVVEQMEPSYLDDLFAKTPWDHAHDGIPSGIRIRFLTSEGQTESVRVIAGFKQTTAEATTARLERAHAQAMTDLPKDGASLSAYYATIRRRLQGSSDAELRRLLLVIEDQENAALFTQVGPASPLDDNT